MFVLRDPAYPLPPQLWKATPTVERWLQTSNAERIRNALADYAYDD